VLQLSPKKEVRLPRRCWPLNLQQSSLQLPPAVIDSIKSYDDLQ
jgi:hypothetical protein